MATVEAKAILSCNIKHQLTDTSFVITPGCAEAFEASGDTSIGSKLIHRFMLCDWGEVCEEDAQANDRAVNTGERIIASYIVRGEKIWMIADAMCDDCKRRYITALLPSEY